MVLRMWKARSTASRGKREGMILRMWKARATPSQASNYIQHATNIVFPKLMLSKEIRASTCLTEMCRMESIWPCLPSGSRWGRFAGPEPNKAVVEPEARALLTSFDEEVTHIDVVDDLALSPKTAANPE
jgi:hypothetical protein